MLKIYKFYNAGIHKKLVRSVNNKSLFVIKKLHEVRYNYYQFLLTKNQIKLFSNGFLQKLISCMFGCQHCFLLGANFENIGKFWPKFCNFSQSLPIGTIINF